MTLLPVDWVLIAFIAIFALKGGWKGFIAESIGLIALALAGACVLLFGETLSALLSNYFGMALELARIVGYALCFLLPFITGKIVARFMRRAGKILFLGGLDRVAGIIFGGLVGAIIAGALLAAADNFGFTTVHLTGSKIAAPLKNLFAMVMSEATLFFKGVIPR
jgi:membrane protein required for colicin V production